MTVKPPSPLQPATRKWLSQVVTDFELDSHHLRLLTLACESWDRGQEAREALSEHGLTFIDRYGSPRAQPEAAIESSSRIAFARILRELSLELIRLLSHVPPALRN
jgi:phage terminase small subunit